MTPEVNQKLTHKDAKKIVTKILSATKVEFPKQYSYRTWRTAIENPAHPLSTLIKSTLIDKQEGSHLNTLNTINGAICRLLEREYPLAGAVGTKSDEAVKTIHNPKKLGQFIHENMLLLRTLSMTRINNPSIPQRALTLAPLFPKLSGSTVVFECGCSRGDIGIVLLNMERAIAGAENYFFPKFNESGLPSVNSPAHAENAVDKYFGIDTHLQEDDPWRLSVWGLEDERREQLSNFYRDFQPKSQSADCFQQLSANGCHPETYLNQFMSFAEGSNNLIIITSYMVGQLPLDQQQEFFDSMNRLMSSFNDLSSANGETIWLNQDFRDFLKPSAERDYKKSNIVQITPSTLGKSPDFKELAILDSDSCNYITPVIS